MPKPALAPAVLPQPMPSRKGTKALPPEDRPRERCLRLGPAALSDAELIAILLGTGPAGEDVMALAGRALKEFGSLERLAQASAAELVKLLRGIGPARAAMLQAAFDLGRRRAEFWKDDRKRRMRDAYATAQEAIARLGPRLAPLPQEVFVVCCLDNKHRLLKSHDVSVGTLTTSLVHPREVFHHAIREGAARILVAHNHPSGDPAPSDEDLLVTRRLEEAGRLLGIPVVDHIIIARGGAVSLREQGVLSGD